MVFVNMCDDISRIPAMNSNSSVSFTFGAYYYIPVAFMCIENYRLKARKQHSIISMYKHIVHLTSKIIHLYGCS
jgi:hypothetical protein